MPAVWRSRRSEHTESRTTLVSPASTRPQEGPSAHGTPPRGVWIKERGSKKEALSAVITLGAGDLVCGYWGCPLSPGSSNTDEKTH